jgi:hypothetical protein
VRGELLERRGPPQAAGVDDAVLATMEMLRSSRSLRQVLVFGGAYVYFGERDLEDPRAAVLLVGSKQANLGLLLAEFNHLRRSRVA